MLGLMAMHIIKEVLQFLQIIVATKLLKEGHEEIGYCFALLYELLISLFLAIKTGRPWMGT
jgi:hypothetical protein